MEYNRKTVIKARDLKKIVEKVPDDCLICFKNVAGDNLTVNDYTILMQTDSDGKTFKKLIFDNNLIFKKRLALMDARLNDI